MSTTVNNADTPNRWFYMSAYAAAVKHGYRGTEEEWLRDIYGGADAANASAEAAKASADAAADSAESASGSAGEAEGSATAAAASSLDSEAYAKGTRGGDEHPVPKDDPAYNNNSKYYRDEAKSYHDHIADPVAGYVAAATSEWIDDNLMQETGYVIDKSLTTENAAADAKATGLEISRLRNQVVAARDVEDRTFGYNFSSGGINTTTGATTTTSSRIRTQGAYLINVSPGDVVVIDPPYSARLAFYNKTMSTANFIAMTDTYTRFNRISEDYVGKAVALMLRNEDHPDSDISGEVATVRNYVHYWSVKQTERAVDDAQKASFRYPNRNFSFYSGKRIDAVDGGTSDSTNQIGISSYLGVSRENPIYLNAAGDVDYEVFLYSGVNSASYLTHTGYLKGNTVFDGKYNGIEYATIRFNVRYDDWSTITDEADLKSKIEVRRVSPYLVGSPSNSSVITRRFSVTINTNWPDPYRTDHDYLEPDSETEHLCVLRLPKNYDPSGKPVPLIMLGHGYQGQVTESKWYVDDDTNFQNMLAPFVEDGYAIFDVNNTRDSEDGYPDWGGLPLMSAYIKAWEYIKANYNVEHKLYILAWSMGTTAALNMMKWHGDDVMAASINAPRPICEWRYNAYTPGGTYATEMAEAFGGLKNGAWDSDRLRGFNHYENIVNINGVDYVFEKFPPIKVIMGTADDDPAGILDVDREYFAALKNAGNFVHYREASGQSHGSISLLQNDALRWEVLEWFNRFRYEA